MVLDAGVGPGGIGLVVQVIQGISKAILGAIKCVGYQEEIFLQVDCCSDSCGHTETRTIFIHKNKVQESRRPFDYDLELR